MYAGGMPMAVSVSLRWWRWWWFAPAVFPDGLGGWRCLPRMKGGGGACRLRRVVVVVGGGGVEMVVVLGLGEDGR
jgi:hypothetical protein